MKYLITKRNIARLTVEWFTRRGNNRWLDRNGLLKTYALSIEVELLGALGIVGEFNPFDSESTHAAFAPILFNFHPLCILVCSECDSLPFLSAAKRIFQISEEGKLSFELCDLGYCVGHKILMANYSKW